MSPILFAVRVKPSATRTDPKFYDLLSDRVSFPSSEVFKQMPDSHCPGAL